jgi:hypothetical protein
MAVRPNDLPILIESDDDDEEPSPALSSLEGAINSATRAILINTLLEVCN